MRGFEWVTGSAKKTHGGMPSFMGSRKYKLIRVPMIKHPVPDLTVSKVYRLKALRDIPEHGVKAGDLGGFVCNSTVLSHEGSCWVGGDAQVLYNVTVTGNAYIGDNALVDGEDNFPILIKDNVRILHDAKVLAWKEYANNQGAGHDFVLQDNICISGEAFVRNLKLGAGNAIIEGWAKLTDVAEVSGNSIVSGGAKIEANVQILGKSKVTESGWINKNTVVIDSVISGVTEVNSYETVENIRIDNMVRTALAEDEAGSAKELSRPKNTAPEVDHEISMMDVFREVVASINSYEEDIVKIIKYPVMTDRTDPYSCKMTTALNHAKRLMSKPDSKGFEDAVMKLEEAFLEAESHAIKMAMTMLTEVEQKKVKDAKVMLGKAEDEASTENEKKMAFTQAFKQLEGIIVVPEVAIDAFRIKVGLKEIEN